MTKCNVNGVALHHESTDLGPEYFRRELSAPIHFPSVRTRMGFKPLLPVAKENWQRGLDMEFNSQELWMPIYTHSPMCDPYGKWTVFI